MIQENCLKSYPKYYPNLNQNIITIRIRIIMIVDYLFIWNLFFFDFIRIRLMMILKEIRLIFRVKKFFGFSWSSDTRKLCKSSRKFTLQPWFLKIRIRGTACVQASDRLLNSTLLLYVPCHVSWLYVCNTLCTVQARGPWGRPPAWRSCLRNWS